MSLCLACVASPEQHGDEQGGMELRVLHAAANKVTWYGQWGYNYGRGAFNITHSK